MFAAFKQRLLHKEKLKPVLFITGRARRPILNERATYREDRSKVAEISLFFCDLLDGGYRHLGLSQIRDVLTVGRLYVAIMRHHGKFHRNKSCLV